MAIPRNSGNKVSNVRTGLRGPASNVGATSMHAQPDRNPGVADLDAYSLTIENVSSNVEYYGGHSSVEINMTLRAHSIGDASDSLGKYEDFLRDIEILNNLQKSKHPGVVDLWSQLRTLMVLTSKTDK